MTYKTIQKLSTREEKFTTAKEIVEISCDCCGYDRGILTYSDYASVGIVTCNNPDCDNTIEHI
jgi:hypothetical protein